MRLRNTRGRRLLVASAGTLCLAVLAVAPVPISAGFSASTENGPSSFTAAASFAAPLSQPAASSSCTSETGTGGTCLDGVALSGVTAVAASPDGTSVYVASLFSHAVAAFARDATTGRVTQLAGTAACVSSNGTSGACVTGSQLLDTSGVAVSPDGLHVYVTSTDSNALTAYTRNTSTSALTRLAGSAGCVTETGSSGACVDGKAMLEVKNVVVSPDGKNVYVTSSGLDAVVALSRNAVTGALTPLAGTAGCTSQTGADGVALGQCVIGTAMDGALGVAVSADGKHVYVTASSSSAVVAFSRDASTGALTQLAGTAGCTSDTGTSGACVDGVELWGAKGVTISPDDEHVYVTSPWGNAVAAFARDTTTGALTQLTGTAACVSATGTGGSCVTGKALTGASAVTVSPDGTNVYVAATTADAVAVLARNTTTGALTQDSGTSACLSETGTSGACTDGRALDGAQGLVVSPDGKDVYVVSGVSSALAQLVRDR
jgi:DNA-binding beta-propeller fold protein YncE